jgi:hypothetical protein
MMKAVPLPRADAVRRQWFSDARDDGRRMEISWHRDEELVIVSLWHGSVCRATFRLPIDQAPMLIQTLADALGDAVQTRLPPGGTDRKTSLLDMGTEKLRKHVAEIIQMEGHPKR